VSRPVSRDAPPPYLIRRFRPSDPRALTTLINQAYAELGAEGRNFVGATQDERITKERVQGVSATSSSRAAD
jgi:hypothetical protein